MRETIVKVTEDNIDYIIKKKTIHSAGHSELRAEHVRITDQINHKCAIGSLIESENNNNTGVYTDTDDLITYDINKAFIDKIKGISNTIEIESMKELENTIPDKYLRKDEDKLFLFTSEENINKIVDINTLKQIPEFGEITGYIGSNNKYHFFKSHNLHQENDIIIWDKEFIGKLHYDITNINHDGDILFPFPYTKIYINLRLEHNTEKNNNRPLLIKVNN